MTDQPYTPTTEQIELLVLGQLKQSAEKRGIPVDVEADRADFQRWLAARDAQVAAQALLDAAESNDLIDHMYSHIGGHGLNSPAAVRATATYLHHRADRIANKEGDIA